MLSVLFLFGCFVAGVILGYLGAAEDDDRRRARREEERGWLR